MPINFVTGLPRAGKTLWTLCHVKERAERENRQVYTCNIPGVIIDGWQTIDHPDKWIELPDTAIIIIDELQDFWPKAASSQKPPEPILELSKHGKRGFDFYFITQEPNLVHSTPRDLCAIHYYVVRAWGTHNAVIHKFDRIQLHPDKVKSKSEKLPWRYPKAAFGWYKSADVHNIKRQVPLKLIAIPMGVLVAAGMAYAAFTMLSSAFGVRDAIQPPPAGPAAVMNQLPNAAVNSVERHDSMTSQVQKQIESKEDYVNRRVARVEGLPHTAPIYDELTRPTRVPVPSACVEMRSKGCRCYTQQGTHMPGVPLDLCRQFVAQGYFQDFDPNGRERDRERERERPSRTVERQPDPESTATAFVKTHPQPSVTATELVASYREQKSRP